MKIPQGLAWWRDHPGGECLASLPSIVESCAERWSVRVGVPFEDSHVSFVVPVDQADGTPAVLKINFPDTESEHEPDAVAHWDGRGGASALIRRPASGAAR